jgi:hypothetical protein
MSKETKSKISRFANGKQWEVIETRREEYVIRVGGSVWVVRKTAADAPV